MILGCDPGLTGAIAAVSTLGELVWAEDMPVVDKNVSSTLLAQRLRSQVFDHAVVERVSSMPGQGVVSVFKFGKGYGQVLGVIDGLEIPLLEPTPSQWKRDMGLNSDKERSRSLAIKIWPSQAQLFKFKKDNGRAEAALLALWGLRKLGMASGVEIDPALSLPATRRTTHTGRVIRRTA